MRKHLTTIHRDPFITQSLTEFYPGNPLAPFSHAKKNKFLANRKQLPPCSLGRANMAIKGPLPYPTTDICLALLASDGNTIREVCLSFLF